jgi:hypothetical protein
MTHNPAIDVLLGRIDEQLENLALADETNAQIEKTFREIETMKRESKQRIVLYKALGGHLLGTPQYMLMDLIIDNVINGLGEIK